MPIALADTLLRPAEADLYRPVWSERVLDEMVDAVESVHPNLARTTTSSLSQCRTKRRMTSAEPFFRSGTRCGALTADSGSSATVKANVVVDAVPYL